MPETTARDSVLTSGATRRLIARAGICNLRIGIDHCFSSYHFYETRGRRDGHDVDDWLYAEQELVRHYR